MASKKEVKKRIRNEYNRLSEDIAQYIAINKEEGKEKVSTLLTEIDESQKNFGREINKAVDSSKQYYNDLIKRAVDDIDAKYQQLKAMASKKDSEKKSK
ncbi:MAG: hypothetical protein PF489_08760 [Salinivirgaceae bacterium]|jgi:polyhydroxyalkanoate synthesis regulator phasin|nr:hypothetical protein [Salinivirgaceae bacterium]